jgi:hypothetical protein
LLVVDFDGADCAVGHRAGVGGNAEEVAEVVPDAAIPVLLGLTCGRM